MTSMTTQTHLLASASPRESNPRCHDCRQPAAHAMQIWDAGVEPGKIVALCDACANKRVTDSIVQSLEIERDYEPPGLFVEYSPHTEEAAR